MNLAEEILIGLKEAFVSCFGEQPDDQHLHLQATRKEFAGSYTFVTFPFLKISKKKPEETGEVLGAYLKEYCSFIAGYNVVKGFLNLEITDATWCSVLDNMYRVNDHGQLASNGKVAVVEYSSPNTNKPLHLGHLRNNFLGFSVSQILKAGGYEVHKVQIINDRGIHICKSMLAYEKFGNGETPESAGLKGDHLIGKYYVLFDQAFKKEISELVAKGQSEEEAAKNAPLILEAQQMLHRWEQGDAEVVALWKKMNAWVYAGFEKTYQTMGVDFDKVYYESETYLLGKALVEEGLKKGEFFKKDDGSVWVDLSDQGLDQKLLLRGDGTSVYITQDMGTADMRYNDFKAEKFIYVVGNEQDYHFDVLFKIMKRLGRPYATGMHHLSYGMVDLPSGKMKSREGTVVDADDLMREMVETAERHTKELGKIESFNEDEAASLYAILGLGALKYFLLKVDPKKRMLFDPEESIEFQGNTGPFIQYTHARISAILRKAKEMGVDIESAVGAQTLSTQEVELIFLLNDFPVKVASAAAELSPSIVAQYVFDLSKEYNRFYAEHPILNEKDDNIVSTRVKLSELTARVINSGMNLLGIKSPSRM